MQIYSTSPAPTVPATGLPSNITPDIKDPATRVSPKNTKVKPYPDTATSTLL